MLTNIRVVFLAVLLSTVGAPSFGQGVTLFPTHQQAAQTCPSDVVVWVNTASGVYHFAGERWYGNTKHGAFVCKREADQNGYRTTRNGQ